jgi:hypothetical protein
MWDLLGLRVVRTVLPTFGALLLLAVLVYEPTRLWLMDLVQERAERRVERVLDTVLTPASPIAQPTPPTAP